MRFGVHLPLIDFTGEGWAPGRLKAFAEAARDLGFDSISSNDHLVFQKPWLDGITALASVIDHSGTMKLCTTIAVPAVRHPNVLAKHAAAIDLLSGGRLVLGVGPGSSARDYALVGRDFEQRWKLLDSAVKVLRSQLKQAAPAYRERHLQHRRSHGARARARHPHLDRQLGLRGRTPSRRPARRRVARLRLQHHRREAGDRTARLWTPPWPDRTKTRHPSPPASRRCGRT